MNKIVIPVEGMTCGGCVKSVERTLIHQAGVSTAKASMEDKRVTVEFDASAINQAQLEQAIRKAGFTVPA
ncbi:MAG: heavy-metal-associated domain-containing protein [Rhodospirillaceae bacterium]|nr:heavy-metal-associated domain-containing protein [Rhodospirillaceae bacterium]